MEPAIHRLSDLFRQLGLPEDHASIERFILQHRPLASDVALAEAPFWCQAQAEFLRQELVEDADWAELVDQLNTRLR